MAPFWTGAPPIEDLIGILVNVAGAWNGVIRVGNALAMGMRAAYLNSAVVCYLLSCGESQITGIKVRSFLPPCQLGKYIKMYRK